MKNHSRRARVTVQVLLVAMIAAGLGGCANSGPQHYPVAVIECTLADQNGFTVLNNPGAYYGGLFGHVPGSVDSYFQQVSNSAAALDPALLGPYTPKNVQDFYPTQPLNSPLTLNQYMGLSRRNQIAACVGAAVDSGLSLKPYVGGEIIALQINRDQITPFISTQARLTATIQPTTTTIQVSTSAGFPSPPFPALIKPPASKLMEEVDVTGQSGPGNTTWTVARAFQNGSAKGWSAGDAVTPVSGADGGAIGGQQAAKFGSSHPQKVSAGLMDMYPAMGVTTLPQEIAHGLFNMNHSRDLANPSADYQDPWDVMSGGDVYTSSSIPTYASQSNYNGLEGKYYWTQGPGLNAPNLDAVGWIPTAQENDDLLSNSCNTEGLTLDALSHPQGHYLNIKLPYRGPNNFPVKGAVGTHYDVEYRAAEVPGGSVWDQGIPQPSVSFGGQTVQQPGTVLVHLVVRDTTRTVDPYISYLVDTNPPGDTLNLYGAQAAPAPPGGYSVPAGTPQFVAGSTFVDTTSQAYLGVNGTAADGQAQVTVGNCMLGTTPLYTGARSGAVGQTITLSASLTTNPASGSSFPVPNQQVFLHLGLQQCVATTNLNGHATCSVQLQQPGTVGGVGHVTSERASAVFTGSAAYAPGNSSATFTVIPSR